MEEVLSKPVVVEGFLTISSVSKRKIHLRIRKNTVWGIVSAKSNIRELIVKEIVDGCIRNKLVKSGSKLRCMEDNIINVGNNALENLKKQHPYCDEDTLLGMLEFFNLDNCNISAMSEFEKKKLKMIDAYLSGEDVLVLHNLYNNVNQTEKNELDNYLMEFSLCRTVIIIANSDENILEICDKIQCV